MSESNGPAAVKQPQPQALPSHRSGPSSILVSPRQKGNPILKNVRAHPWEYADIPADYVVGATTCALFLSLKYHRLHPEYVYARIRGLQGKYALRLLLVMVDIDTHEESLRELSKTSLVNNVTLVLCWSALEAARYLELFKTYEHAEPTSIKPHQSMNYSDRLVAFVTAPRSVNKTDAIGLVSNFGSIRTAVNAHPEEVSLIAGWGDKKVKRWCTAVREPFRTKLASRKVAVDPKLRISSMASGVSVIPTASSVHQPMTMGDSNDVRNGSRGKENNREIGIAAATTTKTTTRASATVPASNPRKRPAEPDVSDGVLAALSKLRDQA